MTSGAKGAKAVDHGKVEKGVVWPGEGGGGGWGGSGVAATKEHRLSPYLKARSKANLKGS